MESLSVCDPDGMSYWIVLLVISLTINILVVVYSCTDCCLALIRRRRKRTLYDDKRMVLAGSITDRLTSTHRQEAAMLFTESLATFFLFFAALYLLVEGALANSFTVSHVTRCRLVPFADFLFSVAIGRLGVSLVADLRRIRSAGQPEMTAQYARQTLEHALMVVVFLLMTSSSEALLTRTLLCVMPVDHNLVNVRFLLDKCGHRKSAMFAVISCFLSLAFRGLLPLVSLVVSLSAYRATVFDMRMTSISVVIACAIIYTCYNAYVIVTSVIEVMTVRQQRHVTGSSEASGYCANNEFSLNRKSNPIDLQFNKLDLADVTRRDPISEKRRAAVCSRILARMNFADRGQHCSSATSPQNCHVTTCAVKNYTRRQSVGKLSNLNKYLTLLDKIDEETESVDSKV